MKTPFHLVLLVALMGLLAATAPMALAQKNAKKPKGTYMVTEVEAIDLKTGKPTTELSSGMAEELSAARTMMVGKMSMIFTAPDKFETIWDSDNVRSGTYALADGLMTLKDTKGNETGFGYSTQGKKLVFMQLDEAMQEDGMQIKMVFSPVKGKKK